MIIQELIQENSKLFIKSEFAPASNDWPALSFSSKAVANTFSKLYKRGRDFVIYVGTGNETNTKEKIHRNNLLSIISVEPRTLINTKDIVSEQTWEDVISRFGERWEWSLPIEKAFTIESFPKASSIIPSNYSKLGKLENLGRCVEVTGDEKSKLLNLRIEPVDIKLTQAAREALLLNTPNDQLRKELSRLANLIISDVKRSGKEKEGNYPHRKGPNTSEVFQTLNNKWEQQNGLCALCGAAIPLDTNNKLLQISRDRNDSSDKSYDWHNVQLTHCGCNLAKNDATAEHWEQFLAMLRSG